MIKNINYYCLVIIWVIIGGKKPVNLPKKDQSKKDRKVYANWSKAEYQMHFRNAASNLGMLHEARDFWNEQPLEYRRKKEKQWEERYGKDWRKHVVL